MENNIKIKLTNFSILLSAIFLLSGCIFCEPKIVEKIKYVEKPCPKLETFTPEESNVSRDNKQLKLDIKVK